MLDDLTVKVLIKHNQKEVCVMYKNYKVTVDNFVFHQHDGRWLKTNVVRDYFKKGKCSCSLPHAF